MKRIEYLTGIRPCACSKEDDQPCIPCMQYNTLLVLCFVAAVQSLVFLVAVQHITVIVLSGCSTEHDQPCIPCMQYDTLLALYAVFAGQHDAGLVLCSW